MKPYLISLGAGLLIGAIYSFLNVRSPAPPVVALVGLLGMLAGEQALPAIKQIASCGSITAEWFQAQCGPHILGSLPTGQAMGRREVAHSEGAQDGSGSGL